MSSVRQKKRAHQQARAARSGEWTERVVPPSEWEKYQRRSLGGEVGLTMSYGAKGDAYDEFRRRSIGGEKAMRELAGQMEKSRSLPGHTQLPARGQFQGPAHPHVSRGQFTDLGPRSVVQPRARSMPNHGAHGYQPPVRYTPSPSDPVLPDMSQGKEAYNGYVLQNYFEKMPRSAMPDTTTTTTTTTATRPAEKKGHRRSRSQPNREAFNLESLIKDEPAPRPKSTVAPPGTSAPSHKTSSAPSHKSSASAGSRSMRSQQPYRRWLDDDVEYSGFHSDDWDAPQSPRRRKGKSPQRHAEPATAAPARPKTTSSPSKGTTGRKVRRPGRRWPEADVVKQSLTDVEDNDTYGSRIPKLSLTWSDISSIDSGLDLGRSPPHMPHLHPHTRDPHPHSREQAAKQRYWPQQHTQSSRPPPLPAKTSSPYQEVYKASPHSRQLIVTDSPRSRGNSKDPLAHMPGALSTRQLHRDMQQITRELGHNRSQVPTSQQLPERPLHEHQPPKTPELKRRSGSPQRKAMHHGKSFSPDTSRSSYEHSDQGPVAESRGQGTDLRGLSPPRTQAPQLSDLTSSRDKSPLQRSSSRGKSSPVVQSQLSAHTAATQANPSYPQPDQRHKGQYVSPRSPPSSPPKVVPGYNQQDQQRQPSNHTRTRHHSAGKPDSSSRNTSHSPQRSQASTNDDYHILKEMNRQQQDYQHHANQQRQTPEYELIRQTKYNPYEYVQFKDVPGYHGPNDINKNSAPKKTSPRDFNIDNEPKYQSHKNIKKQDNLSNNKYYGDDEPKYQSHKNIMKPDNTRDNKYMEDEPKYASHRNVLKYDNANEDYRFNDHDPKYQSHRNVMKYDKVSDTDRKPASKQIHIPGHQTARDSQPAAVAATFSPPVMRRSNVNRETRDAKAKSWDAILDDDAAWHPPRPSRHQPQSSAHMPDSRGASFGQGRRNDNNNPYISSQKLREELAKNKPVERSQVGTNAPWNDFSKDAVYSTIKDTMYTMKDPIYPSHDSMYVAKEPTYGTREALYGSGAVSKQSERRKLETYKDPVYVPHSILKNKPTPAVEVNNNIKKPVASLADKPWYASTPEPERTTIVAPKPQKARPVDYSGYCSGPELPYSSAWSSHLYKTTSQSTAPVGVSTSQPVASTAPLNIVRAEPLALTAPSAFSSTVPNAHASIPRPIAHEVHGAPGYIPLMAHSEQVQPVTNHIALPLYPRSKESANEASQSQPTHIAPQVVSPKLHRKKPPNLTITIPDDEEFANASKAGRTPFVAPISAGLGSAHGSTSSSGWGTSSPNPDTLGFRPIQPPPPESPKQERVILHRRQKSLDSSDILDLKKVERYEELVQQIQHSKQAKEQRDDVCSPHRRSTERYDMLLSKLYQWKRRSLVSRDEAKKNKHREMDNRRKSWDIFINDSDNSDHDDYISTLERLRKGLPPRKSANSAYSIDPPNTETKFDSSFDMRHSAKQNLDPIPGEIFHAQPVLISDTDTGPTSSFSGHTSEYLGPVSDLSLPPKDYNQNLYVDTSLGLPHDSSAEVDELTKVSLYAVIKLMALCKTLICPMCVSNLSNLSVDNSYKIHSLVPDCGISCALGMEKLQFCTKLPW